VFCSEVLLQGPNHMASSEMSSHSMTTHSPTNPESGKRVLYSRYLENSGLETSTPGPKVVSSTIMRKWKWLFVKKSKYEDLISTSCTPAQKGLMH
jgi:hypothetical protein